MRRIDSLSVAGVEIPRHLVAGVTVAMTDDTTCLAHVGLHAYAVRINGRRADWGPEDEPTDPAPPFLAPSESETPAEVIRGRLSVQDTMLPGDRITAEGVAALQRENQAMRDRIDGIVQRAELLGDQRRRLISILSALTNPTSMESGHPGAPCLRTLWVDKGTVEGWRREIQEMLDSDHYVPAPEQEQP